MKRLLHCLVLALVAACVPACKKAGASSQRLHLFAPADYMPQEVLDNFAKETGTQVDYETFPTNEAMLQKYRSDSSHYDVLLPSDYMVEHMAKQGLLAALDHSKLPNFQNILPEFKNLPFDPGNQFSVPYMSGTVGLIVNADKVKEPVLGYHDLFQPKYTGRIVLIDDPREIVTWAFEYNGIPINDVTPENLAKVKPTLVDWVKLKNIYQADDPKPPLVGGDRDLGVIYSGDAARLYQDNKKFKFILPAEGVHQFVDNLCIPAASKNKEKALQFINYLLRPDVSKLISDKYPYTNPNGAARKLLSKEQLDNPASYPPHGAKQEIFREIGKAADPMRDMMSEIRQSVH